MLSVNFSENNCFIISFLRRFITLHRVGIHNVRGKEFYSTKTPVVKKFLLIEIYFMRHYYTMMTANPTVHVDEEERLKVVLCGVWCTNLYTRTRSVTLRRNTNDSMYNAMSL